MIIPSQNMTGERSSTAMMITRIVKPLLTL
ncbi:hypothetical protein NC653_029778 [Populus alba x Populus x berolinensis]|uniref:Uncharacterized protein n=1 Tax=Populus alba x Populus x berolinensis TaxID=444605 RepID=A0AAD6M301_9ROSI|nr:hypothetical protein NC653_029778 [Populus alba x Populus x berolinensis]